MKRKEERAARAVEGPSHLKRSLLKGPGRESRRQPPSKFVIWRFRVAFFWSPHTIQFGGILGQRLAAVQTSARDSVLHSIVELEKFNRMPETSQRAQAFPIEDTSLRTLTSILMTAKNSQISPTFVIPSPSKNELKELSLSPVWDHTRREYNTRSIYVETPAGASDVWLMREFFTDSFTEFYRS